MTHKINKIFLFGLIFDGSKMTGSGVKRQERIFYLVADFYPYGKKSTLFLNRIMFVLFLDMVAIFFLRRKIAENGIKRIYIRYRKTRDNVITTMATKPN